MKELLNSLNELKDSFEDETVSCDVLFNKKFMKKYTKFNSIDELFDLCNISNSDDIDTNMALLDEAVANNSNFENYTDMEETAACEYQEEKIDKIFK